MNEAPARKGQGEERGGGPEGQAQAFTSEE